MTTATTTRVATLADLAALEGTSLGTSSWIDIPQQRIDTFADATDDHQWIHVDPERARAESPFGGPIAHGYLTLSLIIPMWDEILTVDSVTMAVNYGLNKVRFTNPVPAEGRVRLSATLQSVEELPKGGVQVTIAGQIELEGSERPAVVVEAVYRFFE
ncbi:MULTISPECIES: MaoC family dehydratase [Rhodococcus]|uniref:p-hydroxycinnamoyl-CoA hydratase n=1 Tax=Rhodococcus pseudokoreensis TaxID=2811421 RepID=A0A974W2Y1_9NOCA|nr:MULTISPECIES: MaoC family dehydratase [Rhodococcus]MBV6759257.1 p-hydroxycinnamoyl-CoA hydratase [Rhodococcus opacus]QSE90091.1 p-hydroxycinnamoyl-CoA hydratase [Rhodococcus pseudokoreensis]